MKKSVLRRGFTLIELLVVIAIIGVLSTIVLGSVNTARSRGSDAAIKGNLSNVRAAAEIYYGTSNNYGTAFTAGACAATAGTLFADTSVNAGITAAGNASNGTGLARGSCVSSNAAWAVSVPLKETATDSWCVDSTGASKKVTPAGTDLGFSGVACK